MKKTRLELDSLKVESFAIDEPAGRREGTVFGMLDALSERDRNQLSASCDAADACLSGWTECCEYTDPLVTTCQIEVRLTCMPQNCEPGGSSRVMR